MSSNENGSTKAEATPADSTAESTTPETYISSKKSLAYLQAKQDLADGNFESALTTIATAIDSTRLTLPNPGDELHESLAPLNYLYGTTLLYSIEENTDESQMMVPQQSQCEDGGDATPADAAAETAEDLQIAWENLEMARSILESIIAPPSAAVTSSNALRINPENTEKSLDLAQIHQRLGDLQRANGNYREALLDYDKCLEIRCEIYPGGYDRKVADCHFSVGATCLLLAAEGGDKSKPQQGGGAGLGAEGTEKSERVVLTEKEIGEYKEKSILHYLACGRSFGGVIGLLCGVDPNTISVSPDSAESKAAEEEESDDEEEAGKGKGKSKSITVETTEAKETATSVSATSSKTMQIVRANVASLKPIDPQDADTVSETKELLDEIQETIDSSEESIKVMKDVSKLKHEAEEAAEAEDRKALMAGLAASATQFQKPEEKKEAPASTTQIGFGGEAATSTTTVGFGNGAASATAAAAPTMMVVKKKKKRELPQTSSTVTTEAKNEETSNETEKQEKRQKTE